MSEHQARLRRYMSRVAGTVTPANRTKALESFEAAFPELPGADTAVERLIEKTPLATSDEEREVARRAHKKLVAGEALTRRESRTYEAVVVPTGRPAVLIENDSFPTPPEPWEKLREAPVRARIERAIRAVGRVEIYGSRLRPYAGTAFVVGPGLLMTNRHVAGLFARGEGLAARFVSGLGAGINFAREHRRAGGPDLPVARVAMLHPYWDMAILEVEGLAVEPLALQPDAPADCAGREVVVIGYPAKDPYQPSDVQERVFGGLYQVKRLQPGFALGHRVFKEDHDLVGTLAHDSSTLGGNSGSAVIDTATGHVVGLHFAGEYLEANYAVPASELSRDGRVRDAGVRFASGSAEVPGPWERYLERESERVATTLQRSAADAPSPPPVPSPRAAADPGRARAGDEGVREVRVTIELDVVVRVDGARGEGA